MWYVHTNEYYAAIKKNGDYLNVLFYSYRKKKKKVLLFPLTKLTNNDQHSSYEAGLLFSSVDSWVSLSHPTTCRIGNPVRGPQNLF
jgi:hypothetical protein